MRISTKESGNIKYEVRSWKYERKKIQKKHEKEVQKTKYEVRILRKWNV